MMDENDGERENEDSEEENWTGVWDETGTSGSTNEKPLSVTCAAEPSNEKALTYVTRTANQKPPLVTCATGSTNPKAQPDRAVSAKENDKQANDSASDSTGHVNLSRMGLNDNKAGMEGLDKDHINRVMMEASKGSKFYENQLKKEAVLRRHIADQQKRVDRLSTAQIDEGLREADHLLAKLEVGRDMSRTIVHVDMDAFYAAVEMRDDPSLRTKPMAVGGMSMLSTSNYLARRYGVRAGMPGFIAKKLCPSLTIVPCNSDKYIAVSKEIRETMSEYDPNFGPMGLDEAYLDLTEHLEKRKNMCEKDRTFSQHVDSSLLCECNQKSPDNKPDASGVNDNGLNEKMLETENSTNEESLQVYSSFSDSDRQNCDQEKVATAKSHSDSANGMDKQIESGAKQNSNLDSANETDKEIEIGAKQNNNMDPANGTDSGIEIFVKENGDLGLPNGTDTSEPFKIESLCKDCGKSRDPSLFEEKVTFGTSVEEAVNEMRFRIEAATRLTASAGIAPNTMLAKVCSDKNKPNGQYTISSTSEAVMAFINELPLKKVCGIGKVSQQMLSALDIMTCRDLYVKRGVLFHLYSTTSFHHFMQICAGIGSTRVERDGERKSMSVERTFPALCRPAELYKKCYELSEKLSEDLKEESIMGKTVTLKLKTVKFESTTRAQSLLNSTCELEQIYSAARDLLRAEMQNAAPEPLHLRLMGVRMSNLSKMENTEPKQSTILGCFKKCQAKVPLSQQADGGTLREGGVTQRSVTNAPLYSRCDDREIDSIRTAVHDCDGVATSPDRGVFSKQNRISDNVRSGNVFRNESAAVKVMTREDLLSEGRVCDLWNCPSEDVQKIFDEMSTQQNTSIVDPDTYIDSHRASSTCDDGNDLISLDKSTQETLTCPVCCIPQRGCDLGEFNSHVDSCLSKQAIRELLEADKKGQHSASREKRLSEDNHETPSAKKRRLASPPSEEQHASIQTFFKGPPC